MYLGGSGICRGSFGRSSAEASSIYLMDCNGALLLDFKLFVLRGFYRPIEICEGYALGSFYQSAEFKISLMDYLVIGICGVGIDPSIFSDMQHLD